MRLSQILFKQHLGRQMRLFWYYQGKKTLVDTLAEKKLAEKGIKVLDPKDVFKKSYEKFDFSTVNHLVPKPPLLDNTNPDWHDRPCLAYKDDHLLTLGMPQAQLITKTVVFEDQLPQVVESLTKDITNEYQDLVKKAVQTSVIFDAHQELLPKRKDRRRPAFVFPREYGITSVRKISNLSKKLLQLCECISGPEISNTRNLIDNVLLSYPFEKEFDLYKFLLTMDVVLMSDKPLTQAGQVNEKDCNDMELPMIEPMHHTIGLQEENIYKLDFHYPLVSGYTKKNIHTIIAFYDPTKVKHVTGLQTIESQVFARALLKAFTAAASSAVQRFGPDVKELPDPITVQCIQSDGKGFYFLVYQLNTLNLDGQNGIKNYCWTLPKMDLYEVDGYVGGKPVLNGYNPEVFKRILAFYKNN